MIYESILMAIMSSVIGYVYSSVLIQPGEILYPLFKHLRKALTKVTYEEVELPEELKGLSLPEKREVSKEHWLLKPLGSCEKCTSGNISNWLFLFYSIIQSYYMAYGCIFTLANHVFTICLAILLTKILSKLMLRL